ncbi:GNAT family N-acetyltransferase, partial [Eubacteriales bacterium OttesenSCG-928-A19]|nr:GNAT family N-acetyltransferase [Eubacteriales bacterium OttesenSCG-928-A19]
MVFRSLEPRELEAWFAHCQSVFRLEDTEYFRRHFLFDPHADASLIFVAMDGEVIASSLRVFRRHIWLKGRVVAMGGIGEVGTKLEYRKRGLAAELLQLAIAAMETQGMPVSILFGDQPIYERAGWR